MKIASSSPWSRSLLLAALALVGLPLAAQEQENKDGEQEFDFPLLSEQSPQDEMIALFHEVERTLESIDIELADAGAGESPLGEGSESGIERLLDSAAQKGQAAVSGIDRILELAEKMGGSCSSCMKPGGEGQPKESPLDQERDRGPKQRENTPDTPQDSQPKPEPSEGDTPKDSTKPDQPNGQEHPGSARLDEAGTPQGRVDDAERWGMLPDRVQQVFQNQLTDDLPFQYRDWIDSYYRRLNTGR
jgi:hypothetical protein